MVLQALDDCQVQGFSELSSTLASLTPIILARFGQG